MTLFDFLQTPAGLQLVNAFTLLVAAIAGYLTWLTRQTAKSNEGKLDAHIEEHRANGTEEH